MKITKFKRALSVLLVAVMIISTLPLNAMGLDEMERSTRPADSTNNIFEDLFWELIKPFIKPKVTVKGLPENAEGGIEIVTDPFSSKAKSSLGTFLDFYDIKAKDKTTGEIVHPEGEVEVTIKDARIKQNQSVFLIHVLDDENVIKNADNVTLVTEAAFVSAFKDAAKAAENALGVSGAVAVEFINDLQISGRDITFKTDSFSIYIIAEDPRIKVSFKKSDSSEIYSVVVKKSDKDNLENVIYDAPIDVTEYGDNILFRGWSSEFKTTDTGFSDGTYVGDGAEYTADSNALTIDQVRAAVKTWFENNSGFDDIESSGTNKVTLNFYTMLFYNYVITYFDENGNVCLGRDSVLIRTDAQKDSNGRVPVNYQLNINYVPEQHEGSTVAFLGWNLLDGNPDSETDNDTHVTGKAINALLGKEEQINIYGNVFVSAHVEEGRWLTFDENGKGATYNAPKFIKTQDVTVEPDREMKRFGYTFGGWYDTKAHAEAHAADTSVTTGKFEFGHELSDNTTIYASWVPNETANYTIIIWKQNVDGENYDFAESLSMTGNVGEIIDNIITSTSTVNVTGETTYRRMDPQPTENGYYYININGRYDRVYLYRYNNRWYTDVHNWRPYYRDEDLYNGDIYEQVTTGGIFSYDGFHYKDHDKNVVIKTEGNSVVNVYFDRNQYTLTFRRDRNGTVYKTITALYGQYIGDEFPINTNGASATWRWSPQNSQTYRQVLVYIDIMPAEDVTFYRSEASYTTKYMEFYIEALPGQTPDRTWNGKSFVQHGNTISCNYNFFTEAEDFIELTGCDKYGSDPQFNNNGQTTTGGSYTLRLYYTRKAYDINYMDGKYIDGDMNPVDEASKGQLGIAGNILYGANLSEYNKGGSSYFVPVDPTGEYVFEGWYVDDACTQPYTFKTMPEGGITVHAKWIKRQYRVFLHPNAVNDNGSNDTTLDWGSDSQAMSFRVSFGGDISLPEGRRTGYQFVGWFTDPACTKPYAASTKLNEDTVTAAYNKSTDMTDTINKWGDVTDPKYNSDLTGYKPEGDNGPRYERFWIEKKLELYGLWRKDLGDADGVKIEYYAYDSDSGEYKLYYADPATYLDTTLSYGLSAPGKVTKTVDGVEKTYYFKCWVEQAYITQENSTAGGFRPEVVLGAEPTLVDGARIIYPGEKFYIKSDYGFEKEVGENKYLYKHIVAVYVEAEAPVVDVKYDRNATDAVWSIGSEVEAYKDNNNESVYYKKYTDDQYGFAIEINKEFSILKNEDYLTRTGYKFLGWAFDKTMTAAAFISQLAAETAQGYSGNRTVFAGGEDGVAADDLDTPNSSINTLYAIWEINRYDVEVDKVLVNKGVDDDTWNAHPFTVHYKYELEGYDTVEGTLTVKANDTTLPRIQNIPHGAKLTVWEVLDTNDAKIFTTDHDTSSKYEITSVTAEKDGDLAATVTITNTRKDVDLYIRKFVDLDKDAEKTFKFNVTVTNGTYEGTSPVSVTSAKTGTDATGTKITVPYGSTVTVSEVTNEIYENGYTVAQIFNTPAAQTVDHATENGQTLDFENTRRKVKVYVEKFVKSLDNADATTFTFTVNGKPVSTIGTIKNDDDPIEINHTDASTNFVEVYIGDTVTVVETDNSGYTTEWVIYGAQQQQTTNNGTTADIGTVYEDTTVIFTNKRPDVVLTIEKDVDKDVDKDTKFDFSVVINGTETHVSASENESWTKTVPYGSVVTISENMDYVISGDYKVSDLFKDNNHPAVNNVMIKEDTTYTFKNERRVGKLTVTKEVVSDYAPDYTTKEYKFKYTVNGGTPVPFSITIDGNKTNTYTIPVNFFVGDVVVVTEDDLQDAYMTQSDAVEVTIAEGDGNAAKITNTRKDVTVTVIKKLAEEDSFNTDKNFTFSVGNGVENQTATVGGANAVFTLTYGTVFTLEEIGLGAKYDTPTFETTAGASVLTGSNGSYTAMGDGTITVTNKVKRIPVTVKKTVNGDADDKAADYNFAVSSSIGSVTSDAEGKTAIATLVIKGGNETTVYVPYGATLTATETGGGVNGREYKTTIDGEETKTHTTGTLTAEGTTIEFVNTRIVTVTVVKAVPEGDEALVGSDTFAVTVDGDNVADNDKSFNISLTLNKTFKAPYNSTFTVTESLGSLAWKYQTPEYSGGSNTYTATADTTVTITNKLQEYTVTVKKTGTTTYPANHPFKFNVEGFTGVGIVDGVTEITLGGSKTWTVKAGSKIDVTEQSDDYTASSTRSVTGSDIVDGKIFIKADTTITFDNTIKTQKVTIKKIIDNSELGEAFRTVADQNATEFSITYVVNDANGSQVKSVSTTIVAGTDITVDDVPYGGSVTVTEAAQTLFEVSYTNNGATVKDDSTVITITNKRKATSLTINKTVESSVDADNAATYNFTVTVDGVTTPVSAAVTVTNGEGSTTINGLPLGAKVTVTETVPQNMTVDKNDQVIEALAAEGNALSFKNTRPNVEIPVEKIVKSRVEADYGKDYTFSYEYTVDDHKYEGTATISIDAKPANANTMNGTTTVTVPKGATAFKLTEDTVDANLTVTYSIDEIAINEIEIAGPITTSPAKVTVTNERPEIPVTIEKVVVSDIDDYSSYGFKFDYTVKFGDETIEIGEKTITGAGTNNEITVPKGADITVTEQTGVKYTTINNADFTVAQVFDTTYSSDTLTGVVAEGGKITVTNTRKLVEVTVKKVVDNKWNIASDLEKEFSFNFDSAKMYTGADYATVITSADTKKLKHDGEIKIKVPFGATFTATETEDPAFDTTVKIGSTDAVKALSATTAQLTADGTVITFTNTRKPIKVEVQKHVNKFFDEDIDEKFYFEAAVMFGGSAWALPTADRAFDLMDYLTDNTRKHVFEVPYGSNIQVKEVNHTGFTSSATLNGEDYDQNMTATPLTQDATVIIKNDRDRVTITVTKTVATDAKLKTVDEAINFPFTYSWTKNENFKRDATSFPLKHGQEYTFTVPVGAAVNVNELTDTELTVYNNLKISDVFATVSEYGTTTDDQTVSFNADAATTVAFTNTHKTVKVNLVKAVNLEQDKNVNFEFTWSAVYGTGENAIDFTTDNGTATRNHNTTATLLCTVPVGVKISVTEILPSEQGFVTPNIAYTTGAVGTVDGAVVTISDIKADATITYTNSRQVFDITFGKKVVNGVANDNEFPFRFTYTDNGGEEHEVFISDNGSITIPKVPYGHTIVITEDVLNQLSAYGNFKVADIFATAISGQSGNCTVDGAKVTITVKKDENITFTNTHKTSTVTITKTVESKNESDKQHEFPFSATAHAGNTYVIGSADEKDSFSLKHTGTKVYTVPYGFEFTVGEEPDTRYNTSIKFDGTSEAAQVKSFTAAKDAYTIAYLNERAQGDLKIVKTGVGETTDAFLFKVTKNNDTTFKPLFVTIHGNGSVYVMQLEAGDYLVEEVTDWSWRYDKQTEEITNEADGADKTDNMATIMGGETGDEAPTVTFTNKKNNKNWLGTECGGDNKYDPQLTAAVDPAAEQVAWDSKIRLAYASPADKFRDNKETA